MAEDLVNIEIDGKPLQAAKGSMLIEVADEAGISIPRFCYHEKLTVAANCRMCLVDVERAPKPLPACATPIVDGMKAFTHSKRALAAQRATMEFLLINHPLDCPVCDQGGECELQDLAMGYGRDISRYTDQKRVVKDKNIGPLISTDMTRCIHCTRCVRFGTEIAGIQELGATGRGEFMRIGTYVEQSIDHELSGNVIDLCPVGALNSKPFRMRGRGWEMTQHESIAPHDCVGSSLFGHALRGKLMRVVPRGNEAVNEVWLSDRDRFSYTGLYSGERLERPMVKVNGEWRETDWEAALGIGAKALRAVADKDNEQLGVLASPSSTSEELYLLARLARELDCCNIDTRVRQADFRDASEDPVFPWLGQSIAELEQVDAALIVGSNLRKEVPLVAHRLRKAVLKGANAMFINPRRFEYRFPVANYLTVPPAAMNASLAAVLKAVLAVKNADTPAQFRRLLERIEVKESHRAIAERLIGAERGTVLLGHLSLSHPAYADIRALAAAIAEHAGVRLGYLPQGANAVGACLAGAVPHRQVGGEPMERPGLDARAMLEQPRKGYLLLGLEPELDCFDGAKALRALKAADEVVAITSFVTDAMQDYATVLLPAAAFGETSGTFVNAEGRWQSFSGMARPVGEARPAWKILRVLGNLLGFEGFDYDSSAEVRDALRRELGEIQPDNSFSGARKIPAPEAAAGLQRAGEVPIYAIDALVRRAEPLQQTEDGHAAVLRIAPADAEKSGLAAGGQTLVKQHDVQVALPVVIDEGMPEGTVWVPAGLPETVVLGAPHGQVEVEKI
jgi:NADH-quinone oxidoreductase subunit G